MEMKKIYILLGIIIVIIIVISLLVIQRHTRPNQFGYQVSNIEEGGYSGTAFCNIIGKASYTISDNSITIYGKGPYKININEMKNTFSPYEYPDVNLILRIKFEDKDITYADVLYIGDDNNLYACHGGK